MYMSSKPLAAQTNSEKNNEMNNNIYNRNVPSAGLAMQLDMRPKPTKYTVFPAVAGATVSTPPIVRLGPMGPAAPIATYNGERTFNPGTSAPWSGYAANIDRETDLHNSKMSARGEFGASTNSDMYATKMNNSREPSNRKPHEFPDLFEPPVFSTNSTNSTNSTKSGQDSMGGSFFNQSTRYSVKGNPT